MDPGLKKMLASVDGTAVRRDYRHFSECMGINRRKALMVMMDLVRQPPEGYSVREVEGDRFTIEIRRIHYDK